MRALPAPAFAAAPTVITPVERVPEVGAVKAPAPTPKKNRFELALAAPSNAVTCKSNNPSAGTLNVFEVVEPDKAGNPASEPFNVPCISVVPAPAVTVQVVEDVGAVSYHWLSATPVQEMVGAVGAVVSTTTVVDVDQAEVNHARLLPR